MDNAKTYTAKAYSLLDFGKFINTRYPTDTLRYADQHSEDPVTDCHFKTGSNMGLRKGLIGISKDLNIKLPPKLKLDKLRGILYNHPAFKTVRLAEYFPFLFLYFTIFRYHVLNSYVTHIILKYFFVLSFMAN